jgi:hypothetical protein
VEGIYLRSEERQITGFMHDEKLAGFHQRLLGLPTANTTKTDW